MNFFFAIIFTMLTAICLLAFRSHLRANPVFWYIVFHWVMGIGVIFHLDFDLESDTLHLVALFLSLIAFFIGAFTTWINLRVSLNYNQFFAKLIILDSKSTRTLVAFIFGVSIVVTILYYQAVGRNIFADMIFGAVVEDFVAARLYAYSGDQYFAPGYANQFKNMLLPVTFVSLLMWAHFMRKYDRLKLLVLVGVPILSLALLGTGQRAFLIYSFAAIFFGVSTLIKIPLKRMFLLGLGVLFLFAYLTAQYKIRHFEDSENILLAAASRLLDRVFIVEQEGSAVAFRVLYDSGIVYFEDWVDQIVGLLPYVKGSTVQHDLFAVMHGTDRGTHGFSTVVSVLFNGGFVLLIFFYVILGSFYTWLYNRFLKGDRFIFRSIVYGYLFFYLSIFVTGGPSTPINNGVVALLILLVLRKLRFTSLHVPVRI